MFGSSAGVPYWHQATASSPSKTRAACALPSRTRRSFQGRPFSPSGLPSREWNHVHQQPPNPHPLCLSSSRSSAFQVEASSALISYSLIAPPPTRIARLASGESMCFVPGPAREKPPHLQGLSDGARRTRTADLLGAIQALSQLSYSPGEGKV